jgi:hypothetical protein
MFKHGTVYQRRIANVQGLFNYRTILFDLISVFYFAVSDLSGTSLLPLYWHAVYICLFTPLYFFVAGAFSKDIASDYMNRIFGEYKGNFAFQAVFSEFSYVFAAIFDAVLIFLIYAQSSLSSETPRNRSTNSYIEFDSLNSYSMLMVNAVLVIRMKTKQTVIIAETITTNVLTLIMLLFLLENGDLANIQDITCTP